MKQTKSGNMAVLFALVALLVVVAGGGYWYVTQQKAQIKAPTTQEVQTGTAEQGAAIMEQGGATGAATTAAPVKEFTVEGANFKLTPSVITVKKGDTVRVTFVNNEGFHDFKIDEFNVATKQINKGETDVVEFVADKVGTFEYYCGVGAHRANGMTGTLTVE